MNGDLLKILKETIAKYGGDTLADSRRGVRRGKHARSEKPEPPANTVKTTNPRRQNP